MKKYIQSELLKNKGCFAVKMLIGTPVLTILLAVFVMSGNYVQVLAYNWWYLLFLPFVFAYVSVYMISSERKRNYHGLFNVVEKKQKVGYGKVIVATFYLAITNLIFFLLTAGAGIIFEKQISFMDNLLAAIVLTITFAWQIPLVIILSLKINTIITIILGVVCNIIIACVCAEETLWWIPFAIPSRMMCIILDIRPNGLLAEEAGLYGGYVTLAGGMLLTMILYVAITFGFGKIFSKQEA